MRTLLAAGLPLLLLVPLVSLAKPPAIQSATRQPTLSLPNPNVALTVPYTAQVADAARTGKFPAGDATWECAAGTCRTLAAWPAPTVAACTALAVKAGRVVRFGSGKRLLNAAQLGECNAGTGAPAPRPQLRDPAVRVPAAAAGAVRSVDKRALYEQVRVAREKAERDAADRAVREEVAARNAEAAAFERRRIALGYTERRGQGGDCDDTQRSVHPLAAEVCDLVDNDCNGIVDEGQTFRLFLDDDGDGHGDPALPVDVCPVEQRRAADEGRWLVPNGNDCDDKDPSRWQGC